MLCLISDCPEEAVRNGRCDTHAREFRKVYERIMYADEEDRCADHGMVRVSGQWVDELEAEDARRYG